MNANGDGRQALGRERCLALMASAPIGRVVYTDQALPAIAPVSFVLDGDQVIMSTGPGAKLAAAIRDAVVAFQVDDYDPGTGTGWSITMIGQAQAVRAPEEIARLARLPLRPWVNMTDGPFIRISSPHLSGRRIDFAAPIDAMNEHRAPTAPAD